MAKEYGQWHVWQRDAGKWCHHNTFDNRDDAISEYRDLRDGGTKATDLKIIRTYRSPVDAYWLQTMGEDLNAGSVIPNELKL